MRQILFVILILLSMISVCGCKRTPNYIGTYQLKLTNEEREKMFQTLGQYKTAYENARRRDEFEMQQKAYLDRLERTQIIIKPDKTCEYVVDNRSRKGVYEIHESHITLILDRSAGDMSNNRYQARFDPEQQTLTLNNRGVTTTFRKIQDSR